MSHEELSIEVELECIPVWKESWAKRTARVTLLVDFKERFVIVVDASYGFWFLPGGGVENHESIEEAAKREAIEELGLEVKVEKIIKTFHLTLDSMGGKERFRIPPFIVVYATGIGGRLKTGYAPDRKVLLVKKNECNKLLRDFKVPREFEWMKPYFYVSKETIREFVSC